MQTDSSRFRLGLYVFVTPVFSRADPFCLVCVHRCENGPGDAFHRAWTLTHRISRKCKKKNDKCLTYEILVIMHSPTFWHTWLYAESLIKKVSSVADSTSSTGNCTNVDYVLEWLQTMACSDVFYNNYDANRCQKQEACCAPQTRLACSDRPAYFPCFLNICSF